MIFSISSRTLFERIVDLIVYACRNYIYFQNQLTKIIYSIFVYIKTDFLCTFVFYFQLYKLQLLTKVSNFYIVAVSSES